MAIHTLRSVIIQSVPTIKENVNTGIEVNPCNVLYIQCITTHSTLHGKGPDPALGRASNPDDTVLRTVLSCPLRDPDTGKPTNSAQHCTVQQTAPALAPETQEPHLLSPPAPQAHSSLPIQHARNPDSQYTVQYYRLLVDPLQGAAGAV